MFNVFKSAQNEAGIGPSFQLYYTYLVLTIFYFHFRFSSILLDKSIEERQKIRRRRKKDVALFCKEEKTTMKYLQLFSTFIIKPFRAPSSTMKQSDLFPLRISKKEDETYIKQQTFYTIIFDETLFC